MLVKDLSNGEIFGINKNLDYSSYKFSKSQINSVCIKTIEEWNIDKMLARQKKTLIEEDYPKILYELSY